MSKVTALRKVSEPCETVEFSPPSGEADSAWQMIFALNAVIRVLEAVEHGHYASYETAEFSERAGLITAARVIAEQLRMKILD